MNERESTGPVWRHKIASELSNFLKGNGLVDNIRRGVWSITEKGKQYLTDPRGIRLKTTAKQPRTHSKKYKSPKVVHADSRENQLEFIKDTKLRNIIESALDEAGKANDAEAYRLAYIMYAACAEAILKYFLNQNGKEARESFSRRYPKKQILKIDDWSLGEVIGVCKERRWVLRQKDLDFMRELRNSVHLHNDLKDGAIIPGKSRAGMAQHLFDIIAKEIEARLATGN